MKTAKKRNLGNKSLFRKVLKKEMYLLGLNSSMCPHYYQTCISFHTGYYLGLKQS